MSLFDLDDPHGLDDVLSTSDQHGDWFWSVCVCGWDSPSVQDEDVARAAHREHRARHLRIYGIREIPQPVRNGHVVLGSVA